MDNLSNSTVKVIDSIESITSIRPHFYPYDLRNKNELQEIFDKHKIDSVIHFAWLKAVGESMQDPIAYYENNVVWSINLFEAMLKHNCKKIVFSSSCTVYGDNPNSPFSEDSPKSLCESPYGWTKSVLEDLLFWLFQSQWFQVANLRYFNPIGAHSSGLIGEDPSGIPNNLMPYVIRTAVGMYDCLQVFGGDYPTPDGTCIRDYIHVVDLAQAHLHALDRILKQEHWVFETFNIGTGKGTSVLEIIHATEEVIGKPLVYKIVWRREWDVVSAYANPEKAKQILWRKAKLDVKQAISDMRNFQNKQNT